jgi:predicted outer membrane repeat protein
VPLARLHSRHGRVAETHALGPRPATVAVGTDDSPVTSASFSCTDCRFNQNVATGCNIDNGGGAVRISESATISGSIFTSNVAKNSRLSAVGGGAVFMVRSSSAYDSSGNTYTDNSAQYGGAIYARGTLTLPSGTFSGNTALTSNGASLSGPACGIIGSPSVCGNNVYLNALGDGTPLNLESAPQVGGCVPQQSTPDFNCAGCTNNQRTCPANCDAVCQL